VKKLLPILLSLFLPLFARSASAAAFSPLQIGIGWPDETAESGLHGFQLVSTNTPVIGLRLNLPGSVNDTVGGLDMGIVSVSETFSGIRLNALLAHSETLNGISLGLIDTTETLNGLQLAPIAIAPTTRGVQIGLFNWCDDLHGVQIGFINNGTYLGSRSTACGLQIGFLNVVKTLRGVQIGFANVVYDSDSTCIPFLRASF
jgi:hypothetical protein